LVGAIFFLFVRDAQKKEASDKGLRSERWGFTCNELYGMDHRWRGCYQTLTCSVHRGGTLILNLFFQSEELDKLYRMVEVEVRGNDPAVLKSYSWFATTAAKELGITVGEW